MEIQILLLPWTSALAFLKALAWLGDMARKGLRATNFSFSEIKTSSKVRSVEVGKRCCPSSRAIQRQRVERQRRKGEQLQCGQRGRPCFRPGKGSLQWSVTSRLGTKGERRNRQTQGSTRLVHYPRKVPTIKKFAVHLLFSESHTVFSVQLFCDCSFNCLICITCF